MTCALLGGVVSARNKRRDRQNILQRAGITLQPAASMDLVDAALCALTAWRLLQARVTRCGAAATGFIVVPEYALAP